MKWASEANILFGICLLLLPWLWQVDGAVATVHIVLGLTVVGVAFLSSIIVPALMIPGWINLMAGIAVIFAPAAFGYTSLQHIASSDVAIGFVITLFAAIRIGGAKITSVGSPPE